jgi:uncharacterized protein (DUF488 family)
MKKAATRTIFTVGHSTLEWPVFLSLLTDNGVRAIADVRSYPGSRRYPHFNRETMATALPAAGVAYHWMPALGGRRKPRKDSKNTAWRNEAFRGYADHMDTAEFAGGLAKLEALAAEAPTAYMCSEAVWWRCHRGLISDALKIRGWNVLHLGAGAPKPHPYTPAATVEDGRLTYGEPTRWL